MLLFALMLAAQTTDEPSPYPPDPPCAESSTYGMSQCMQRDWQVWDKRLNTEYAAALKRVSPQARPWLRQAQQLWLNIETLIAECIPTMRALWRSFGQSDAHST